MAVELKILAWSCVLLMVHIFAAAHFKTRQYGPKWNVGARDEALPPLEPLAGRLVRAQANFLETYPIAIVALLGIVIAGRASEWTAIGGWLWLGARSVYLPLYAAGVPMIRTMVYLASLVGLILVLQALIG
ncbi:Membrane protein [Sphingobium herbicidovorans NBRC 16415]|uniref:Membrane protein n=1 Tax=Sphingobium herbicidovorans (strain ATCC 700291 / DSM 11019 / CCUG 56400 / KCTC 2939 / LMG 18315 / NBRC 16415 / MH) TaxID=1219045 RepID=A0A086PD03_SPHHM|nr:MAPEG family protein [Sphingobium herbicidovorans]KFG91271.1 Membrane protein [Sphingobium herbicidovorans NBRC 16415]